MVDVMCRGWSGVGWGWMEWSGWTSDKGSVGGSGTYVE